MQVTYKTDPNLKFNSYEAQANPQLVATVGSNLENKYEQGRQQIQSQIDQLYNLPSLQGADTEMKHKIINDLNSNLSSISNKDYSDPNVRSQINQYINKYVESGDLVNIAQRAYKKQELVDKYKDLTKKGETLMPWDMQGLNEIGQYEQSGNYVKNKQFNGDVFSSVDTNKLYQDTFKNMEASLVESHAIDKNWRGFDETLKGKALNTIKEATIQAIKNNPNAYGSFMRMAKYTLDQQGKTSAQLYQERLSELHQSAMEAFHQATSVGDVNKQSEALQQIADTNKKLNALSVSGADNISDNWLVEDLIEQKAHEFAEPFAYSERTYKMNEDYKMNKQYSQDIEKMKYQAKLDAGMVEGIPSKSERTGSAGSSSLSEILEPIVKGNTISPDLLETFLQNYDVTVETSTGQDIKSLKEKIIPNSITIDNDGKVHYKVEKYVHTNEVPAVNKHFWQEGESTPEIPAETKPTQEDRTEDLSTVLMRNYKTGKLAFSANELNKRINLTPGANKLEKIKNFYNGQGNTKYPEITGNVDPSTLKKGQIYNVNGQLGRWNGTSMDSVSIQ